MEVIKNPYRLQVGGLINREIPLRFKFNGKRFHGYEGDTLASALLANGVRFVARSFKYHRPRGVMSIGVEETNAILQIVGIEDEPNVIATATPLYDGLEATSVNCWPSLRWDLGAINERLHRFLPAGFYYKTFMWPSDWRLVYGRIIRHVTGLGNAPRTHNPDERYEKRFHHCDVLVVGAGPTGLTAALTAAKSGARVMLVDEQVYPGGSLQFTKYRIERRPALDWVKDTIREMQTFANLVHLQRSTAVGYFDHNMVYVLQRAPTESWLRERLWRVRAREVVIATGSIERPLLFPDNDRPGIMLASAAAGYPVRYGVKPGTHAVFLTNNNSAYEAAVTLANNSVRIAAILDTRREVPTEAQERANSRGIGILAHHTIKTVKGRNAVSGVLAAPLGDLDRHRAFSCDLVCISGGWNPTLHLQSQSGAMPIYDERIASFVPGDSVQPEQTVGAASGALQLIDCLQAGHEAGREAARRTGYPVVDSAVPVAEPDIPYAIEPVWELPNTNTGRRAFLDFQADVATSDVRLALRENYESVELVKRYTTAGMGIDQGKTSSVNAIGMISGITARPPAEIGTTMYRPAYTPIGLGAWAGIDRGDVIFPARRTPMTAWFEKSGANMDEAGALFRRPQQLPKAGETSDDAIRRETLAVRNSVGMYDGTPLGKIEMNGPDSVTLLNRVYTNSWERLSIGMGKFGLMLSEDGRLLDDGVTFRLGENHYLMSTGSGAADTVYAHLERLLQCEWRDLRVYLTQVTEQWANICVCGPRARDVIIKAGTDIDLSNRAFPFLGLRCGTVCGVRSRVARVSYTGELSFEINVSARYGLTVWEALIEAGKEYDITPVGSEASAVMRLEKGFVLAGIEGAGIANPYDVGMGWVVGTTKPDFVGKRALEKAMQQGGFRPNVVGLVPDEPNFVPPDGAPIVDPVAGDERDRIMGHVTAAAFSPTLGHSIALAQLDNGREKIGETIAIATRERTLTARVTDPIFVDPSGERMRG